MKDASDDRLLTLFAEDVLVEFDKAGFATVVHNYYTLNHSLERKEGMKTRDLLDVLALRWDVD